MAATIQRRIVSLVLFVFFLNHLSISEDLVKHSSNSNSFPNYPHTLPSSGSNFHTVLDFLATFLGCGHASYDLPFQEVSCLVSNCRPISITTFLAASEAKKQAYSISTRLSQTKLKDSRHAILFFSLLFLSGNVELNPGPVLNTPVETVNALAEITSQPFFVKIVTFDTIRNACK